MNALCSDCANAKLLKKLISISKVIGSCSVCGAHGIKVIRTDDINFVRAIKALIRYYYSEWEYHGRLGGESFQSLLSVENPIIRVTPELDELEYEEFLLSFLQNLDADSQVTVFTAYGRDIFYYIPFDAISNGESAFLSHINEELTIQNYFLVEATHIDKFEPLRDYVKTVIQSGDGWYRSRIGAKRRAVNYALSPQETEYFYEPHYGAAISSPPVELAGAGRLNRPGISFLYLASEPETAIAEVRPHPGDLVSFAEFSIQSELNVADFSQHDIANFFQSDQELEYLKLIVAIENTLATAAPPSNRQLYSLTQFLAEVFRRMGFDGIKFKSTVGTGANLVLFKPTAAVWKEGSSRVVEIERVKYEHSARTLFNRDSDYDHDFDKKVS